MKKSSYRDIHPVQLMFMLLGCIVFLFPLVWMVSRSLMGLEELYTVPPRLFPSKPVLNAYAEVWEKRPFGLYFKNTAIVTAASVLGATLSSALCAYGFARLRFRGRDVLFLIVLSTMMLPPAVTMIPIYMTFSKLGWINTFLPLIVPAYFGGGAFNIFLLRQFFKTIPRDFDEAGRMDGAGSWTIFWRVMLPMALPALSAVAVMAFMGTWNDFLGPLIYLNQEKWFTIAVGLYGIAQNGTAGVSAMNSAQILAACAITTLPVMTVFFLMQKTLISGTVISSGIKG